MKILNAPLSEEFQPLQSVIMDMNFPWFYARRTSDEEIKNNYLYGWVHVGFEHGQWRTHKAEMFYNAIRNMLARAEENLKEILRVRIVANTIAPEPYLNGAHVDFNFPHKTALLYINDADGDTIIYNEQWQTDDYTPELSVLSSVTPLAGRLVCFDGLHYHTGTLPTKTNRRVVMNINYLTTST